MRVGQSETKFSGRWVGQVKFKFSGRCPEPRKLFEKSLTRRPKGENFGINRALRDLGDFLWCDLLVMSYSMYIVVLLSNSCVKSTAMPIPQNALAHFTKFLPRFFQKAGGVRGETPRFNLYPTLPRFFQKAGGVWGETPRF